MRNNLLLVSLCTCSLIMVFFQVEALAQKRQPHPSVKPTVQAVNVLLTEKGYEPASIKLKRGVPARITFVRQAEATCATEVVLPDYGIKKELPLNEPVVVEFTPRKQGKFTFACGMDMVHGKIVVR